MDDPAKTICADLAQVKTIAEDGRGHYAFIDTARISLMILGVFFHAASMFNIDYDWVVHFDTRERSLSIFCDVIHTFRMEAFFLMAGFLASAFLNKHDKSVFLQKRIRRLGAPFLTGFVVVNFVVVPLIANKAMVYENLLFLHHLWFLIVLLIGALLHRTLLTPQRLQDVLPKKIFASPVATVFVVFLIASIVEVGLGDFFLRLVTYSALHQKGVFEINDYVHYLPFYALGAVLFNYRNKIDVLLRCWPLFIVLTAFYFAKPAFLDISWSLLQVVKTLATLSMIGLVLGAFHFIVPESVARPWMSNYSYTMYLVHQPLLYLLRDPVMTLTTSTYLRFALISAAAITLCSLFHIVVSHNKILRFLFNGEA